MKKEIMIPVIILKTRTGYSAFSPAVNGCIATDKTIDSTLKRMKEALEFHFEGEQLVKHRKSPKVRKILKDAFEEYDVDAFYASIEVEAA